MDVRVTLLCGACGKTFAKWMPEEQKPDSTYGICDPCNKAIEDDNAQRWAVTFERMEESITDPEQLKQWQAYTDEEKKAAIARLMAMGRIKITVKDGEDGTDAAQA